MKRPAVFLDRDNTIIHNDGDLGDPDQVKLIQGAAPAIASLCGLGYRVVVVTNQGGVARGKYTEDDVEAVHDRIETMVRERANGARIDGFYYCPYHPQGKVTKYKKEHPTRKPKPGMLLQAAEDLDLDLAQSWMVGDALRDIDAGGAAGCRTVLLQADGTHTSLVDLRKVEGSKSGGLGPKSRKKHEPDFVAKGLVEAVRIIASQRKPEASEDISRTRIAGKRWDAEAMAELQKKGRSKPPPEAADDVKDDPPPTEPDKSEAPRACDSPQTISPTTATLALPPDAPPTNSAAPKAARPFVPWTRQHSPGPASEPPPSPSEAAAVTTPESANPPTASISSDPPLPAPPLQTSADEPAADASTVPPPLEAEPESLTRLNKTLRLILQELRAQRGTSGEFQQLGVVAIAIQAVAFICLLGALWMGGGQGGDGAFLRWIGVALMLQLSVIAVLLFSRPST
jgi:D-glycero-D-manno-heptose 1,7-bisphosphate phosphatase